MAKNGENAALVGWFVVLHSGLGERETSGMLRPVKRLLIATPNSLSTENSSPCGASLAEEFSR
jgi:hypothetical protein